MPEGAEPDVPDTVFSDREHPMQRGGAIRHVPGLRRRSPAVRPHLAEPHLLRELGGGVSIMQDDSDPIVSDPELPPAVLKDATDVKPTGALAESQGLVIEDGEGLAVVSEHRVVRCEPEPPVFPPCNVRGRVSTHPGTIRGHRVCQVGEGLSVVPIHTRPRFELGCPGVPILLEPQVSRPQLPIVLRSVVPVGGGDDLLPVEAADSDASFEPNNSVSILMDRPDLVVAQPVFHGEIGETLAVEAADTLVPTSEPVVALAVLEDGAHGLEPEPWRRTDGAVARLRSRHVLRRRAGGCGDKGKHDDCCQCPTQLTARHQLLHVNNGPSSGVSRNARRRSCGTRKYRRAPRGTPYGSYE